MQAGRELDCEIARKLFRFVVMIDPAAGTASTWSIADKRPVRVPNYSTDVDHAYVVLKHLQGMGWTTSINTNSDQGVAQWTVLCTHAGWRFDVGVAASSLAAAICQAALRVAILVNQGSTS